MVSHCTVACVEHTHTRRVCTHTALHLEAVVVVLVHPHRTGLQHAPGGIGGFGGLNPSGQRALSKGSGIARQRQRISREGQGKGTVQGSVCWQWKRRAKGGQWKRSTRALSKGQWFKGSGNAGQKGSGNAGQKGSGNAGQKGSGNTRKRRCLRAKGQWEAQDKGGVCW